MLKGMSKTTKVRDVPLAERLTMREWLERTRQVTRIPSRKSAAQIIRELRGQVGPLADAVDEKAGRRRPARTRGSAPPR